VYRKRGAAEGVSGYVTRESSQVPVTEGVAFADFGVLHFVTEKLV